MSATQASRGTADTGVAATAGRRARPSSAMTRRRSPLHVRSLRGQGSTPKRSAFSSGMADAEQAAASPASSRVSQLSAPQTPQPGPLPQRHSAVASPSGESDAASDSFVSEFQNQAARSWKPGARKVEFTAEQLAQGRQLMQRHMEEQRTKEQQHEHLMQVVRDQQRMIATLQEQYKKLKQRELLKEQPAHVAEGLRRVGTDRQAFQDAWASADMLSEPPRVAAVAHSAPSAAQSSHARPSTAPAREVAAASDAAGTEPPVNHVRVGRVAAVNDVELLRRPPAEVPLTQATSGAAGLDVTLIPRALHDVVDERMFRVDMAAKQAITFAKGANTGWRRIKFPPRGVAGYAGQTTRSQAARVKKTVDDMLALLQVRWGVVFMCMWPGL